jgi:hypothetical protein
MMHGTMNVKHMYPFYKSRRLCDKRVSCNVTKCNSELEGNNISTVSYCLFRLVYYYIGKKREQNKM